MKKFLSEIEDYYLATECASELISEGLCSSNLFEKLQDFFVIKSFKNDAFEIAESLKKENILYAVTFKASEIINKYCEKYQDILKEETCGGAL